ncbi:MAG: transcriptional regulator, MarR family [Sporomusa sp.]|jgi:MarR family 2-MHQ and catechol resistance regulon transcriptional repressor|nr:transcriptional regulator, MarR family [Sporomusa sp.]
MVITHAENNPERYQSTRALIELISFYDELEDDLVMHFARYNLSRAKFNALIQLFMVSDQGLTQSELSKKMLVSRANITGLIDRLEKEELVVRKTDAADKRVFKLCLTDKAILLMNSFIPIHNNYVHKIMSALNREEKDMLISLLAKLKKRLE